MARYTAAACLCTWAMYIQTRCRVPGSFVLWLVPWIGLALTSLSFTQLARHLLRRTAANDPFRVTVNRIDWWASLLIRVFVYYSLFLFANVMLDNTERQYRAAVITEIWDEDDPGFWFPYSWVTVRYPDAPDTNARLFITYGEMSKLWGAQPVVLTMGQGYFHLPWVSAIERDESHYANEVLKLTPTASAVWKQLVGFLISHARWAEGVKAGQQYLRFYPNDADAAFSFASQFWLYSQVEEAVLFGEYTFQRKPTYEVRQALGTALNHLGNAKRAAEVLEPSIAMRPWDFEAYYHLGYVYEALGRWEEGIAMFEKALERRPNFWEVNLKIAELQETIRKNGGAKRRS